MGGGQRTPGGIDLLRAAARENMVDSPGTPSERSDSYLLSEAIRRTEYGVYEADNLPHTL